MDGSEYGRVTGFRQDIVEFIGDNCFIPTSGNCFVKCSKCLPGKNYTEDYKGYTEF